MIEVGLNREQWRVVTRALEASAERGALGIVAEIQRQTGVFPPRTATDRAAGAGDLEGASR